MKQYWVLGASGQPEGPFPASLIHQGLATEELDPATLACEVGGEEWVSLGSIAATAGGAEAAGLPPATAIRPPVSQDPPEGLLYLPSKLVDLTIGVLKRVVTGPMIDRTALFFRKIGAISILLGVLAAMLPIVDAQWWLIGEVFILWWLIPCLLAMCFLQFVATRFSREGASAVEQTRNEYSRTSAFDSLAIILIAVGATLLVVQFRKVYFIVSDSPDWFDFADFAASGYLLMGYLLMGLNGLLLVVTGGFFLNPALLGMNKIDRSTIGQDGIAIVAAVVKGGLKAAQVSFGIASCLGAALAWCGAVGIIVFREDSSMGYLWLAGGVTLLIYGSLLPLLTYLVSMVVFIVIEFIEHGMGRGARSMQTGTAPAASGPASPIAAVSDSEPIVTPLATPTAPM